LSLKEPNNDAGPSRVGYFSAGRVRETSHFAVHISTGSAFRLCRS
jgi:hypothetical protein